MRLLKKNFIVISLISLTLYGQAPQRVESLQLYTDGPIKMLVLIIAIPGHPSFSNSWPQLNNAEEFPNEKFPILGTFPNGNKIRHYISDDQNGPMPIDEFWKEAIEHYYEYNSNGKYQIAVDFPRTSDGKVITTSKNYDQWVAVNSGTSVGMIINNWNDMLSEAVTKLIADDPNILDDVKLINIVFRVTKSEFSFDERGGYSPNQKFSFTHSITGELLFDGYAVLNYLFDSVLHESFHRIGSMVGSPFDFHGLPDRTTIPLLSLPENNTWGHDLMYNKGPFPSENALYGLPPLLTVDRIFFEWIEPSEIITLSSTNLTEVKLRDVNIELKDEQKQNEFYRAAKVMIHENYKDDLDEYFLLEFRNGTGYDRNFCNIYEPEPHTGLLIWHIKERKQMINRDREFDHYIDLEVAVPYNGWFGNPVPDDDFPRDYTRPDYYYTEVNKAGDLDFMDDHFNSPYKPDGGVHRWELTDDTHTEWNGLYVRRNTLTTNFFTNKPLRGIVTNKITNTTRPSTKDVDGNETKIVIFNIKEENDYMTFDVSFDGGSSSTDDDPGNELTFSLSQNYPNPFNPTTKIKYSIPVGDAYYASLTNVVLKIYDVLGKEVATLVNEEQRAGRYEIEFDGDGLTSGVYFYKIRARGFVQTKKMIFLR